MLKQLLLPVLAAVLIGVSPALAADGDAELRDRLFQELKNAPTESAGRATANAIWEMWLEQAPTEAVRNDVAEAMKARESYNFEQALGILDGVVETAPDYAEGWNQRAFVLFLMDRPDASLEDLDRALELEPRHFAALAGKGIILMRQGRVELGQKALKRGVEIHPYLGERSMIIPEPKTGGEDI